MDRLFRRCGEIPLTRPAHLLGKGKRGVSARAVRFAIGLERQDQSPANLVWTRPKVHSPLGRVVSLEFPLQSHGEIVVQRYES